MGFTLVSGKDRYEKYAARDFQHPETTLAVIKQRD
jgi:hypothetical protein